MYPRASGNVGDDFETIPNFFCHKGSFCCLTISGVCCPTISQAWSHQEEIVRGNYWQYHHIQTFSSYSLFPVSLFGLEYAIAPPKFSFLDQCGFTVELYDVSAHPYSMLPIYFATKFFVPKNLPKNLGWVLRTLRQYIGTYIYICTYIHMYVHTYIMYIKNEQVYFQKKNVNSCIFNITHEKVCFH